MLVILTNVVDKANNNISFISEISSILGLLIGLGGAAFGYYQRLSRSEFIRYIEMDKIYFSIQEIIDILYYYKTDSDQRGKNISPDIKEQLDYIKETLNNKDYKKINKIIEDKNIYDFLDRLNTDPLDITREGIYKEYEKIFRDMQMHVKGIKDNIKIKRDMNLVIKK